MAEILRTHLARRDLDEIWYFIARDNVSAADNLLEEIERKCCLLAEFPELGQLRPEFRTGQYRSFTVRKYVIYYRPVADGILIARVLHGARDHGPLLEGGQEL